MIQKVKKAAVYIVILAILFVGVYFLVQYKLKSDYTRAESAGSDEALELLILRKDKEALAVFEKILIDDPQNIEALWGKAEVLRRDRRYPEAEGILKNILKTDPLHVPSLLSLAYIRYKDDNLKKAVELVDKALSNRKITRDNKALAFMMMGAINSRRSQKGWLLAKLTYATKIRGYFLKAKELAPGLPEVRLGLGTFYLLAPEFIGGNLDKALAELKAAVDLAPDFATSNFRLAQAYQKKGDRKKYDFYMRKARELDPLTIELERQR